MIKSSEIAGIRIRRYCVEIFRDLYFLISAPNIRIIDSSVSLLFVVACLLSIPYYQSLINYFDKLGGKISEFGFRHKPDLIISLERIIPTR